MEITHNMQRDEIRAVVLSALAAVFQHQVDERASRETLSAWDSLKHIELIFAVEDELNIQFPEEVLHELNSVDQIIAAAEAIYAA